MSSAPNEATLIRRNLFLLIICSSHNEAKWIFSNFTGHGNHIVYIWSKVMEVDMCEHGNQVDYRVSGTDHVM